MEKAVTIKQLEELLHTSSYSELIHKLDAMDPADVADLLEEIPPEQQDKIFSILDAEKASDVLVEFEQNELDDFIERATPEELAKFISEMAPDDQADVLAKVDSDNRKKVMNYLPEDERQKLRALLGYDEESAGGIMTPELCVVPIDATVQEAVMAIAEREFDDPISMVFAIDKQGKLEGAAHISELLSKPGNAKMRDVIEKVQAVAKVDEDQETIANNFRKYDMLVMPVVDDNGILVGRITVDDVMDVMQEEAVEDIAHMAGAPDMETHEDSPVKIVALRMPWLMITMFAGLINSVIIQKMIGLTTIEGLAAYSNGYGRKHWYAGISYNSARNSIRRNRIRKIIQTFTEGNFCRYAYGYFLRKRHCSSSLRQTCFYGRSNICASAETCICSRYFNVYSNGSSRTLRNNTAYNTS
jgi:magnesium transporter